MCERTEDAIAIPSKVEVPLPNSSIIAKDLGVPFISTFFISYISMKNVLFPSSNRSDAPIFVNILSIVSQFEDHAGT